MPDYAPSITVLITRRTAAAVLNQFVQQTLGMGTMAEVFRGDRDEEWAVVDEWEIRAIKHGQLAAVVYFEKPGQARIAILDPRRLAKPKHGSAFNPQEFGFQPRVMNWRQECEPYQIIEPIPEVIPGLEAPEKPRRRRGLQYFKPKIIRSV